MRSKFMRVAALFSAFSTLTAFCLFASSCARTDNADSADQSNDRGPIYTVEAAYKEATALGYAGSLDEFIAEISGKDGKDGKDGLNGADGVGIADVSLDEEGVLTVILTDGRTIDCGKPFVCAHTHSEWQQVLAPTCTSIGYNTRVCSKCGSAEYDFISETGHTWNDGQVILAPSCEETGIKLFTCTVCQTTKAQPIAETGHTIVTDEGKEATCTDAGLTEGSRCSTCGKVFTAQELIPATGAHVYEEGNCAVCRAEQTKGLAFALSADGTYYSVSGIGDCKDTTLFIPSFHEGLPVKEIATNAFSGAEKLITVHIPASVANIRADAFFDCKNMESVTVSEDNPSYASKDGVLYDKNKTELLYVPSTQRGVFSVPDGVTKIGERAFYGCISLTDIVIGKSVTEIGRGVFEGCDGLKNIYYEGKSEDWSAIKIDESENNTLFAAARYDYSETAPTGEGEYWHYVDGVATKWAYFAIELTIENQSERNYTYIPSVSGYYTFLFSDRDIILYDSHWNKITGSVYLEAGTAYTVVLSNTTYNDITGTLSIKAIE